MTMCQAWSELIPVLLFNANPLRTDQYNYNYFL